MKTLSLPHCLFRIPIQGRRSGLALILLVIQFFAGNAGQSAEAAASSEVNTVSRSPKLYWFIPDGMRADPKIFDVFRWAKEGSLPNLKRMMEMGSYGYCRPAFPGHTLKCVSLLSPLILSSLTPLTFCPSS